MRAGRLAGAGKGVHVVEQKAGVVVQHLLKMRDDPALVHTVAMKTAGKLVVHPTASHLFERGHGGTACCPVLLAIRLACDGLAGKMKQQIERGRMWKLRLCAEAAVTRIELVQRSLRDGSGE
jgi:hypothetical protein